MKKKKVLITGAKGFIGANLLRRLVAHNNLEVHIFLRNNQNVWRIKDLINKCNVHQLDLTDQTAVKISIASIKPDIVYHLAAYGAYSFQKEEPVIKAVNLDGTRNLLFACLAEGFECFVNTGSSSEYGFKRSAMKESDLLEPNSYYAVYKAAATQLCQYVAVAEHAPIVTLRPFSVYGPYEESTRLVPTLLNSLFQGICPPLVDRKVARDYIYITDMVDAYLAAASRPDLGGEIFNIGSGVQSSLEQIVSYAIEVTGAAVEPKWGTMEARSWDQDIWQADVTKAKKMLKWEPQISLREGISQSVKWFKEHSELYEKND